MCFGVKARIDDIGLNSSRNRFAEYGFRAHARAPEGASMQKRTLLRAAVASLTFASAALADSPHGQGKLAGSERLRVAHCGRSGGAVTLDFAIQPLACMAGILPCPDDGAWTLAGAAAPLSGLSKGGTRGARLTLDDQSLAALESALEAEAAEACGEAVDLNGLVAGGTLRISKSQEHARLVLRAAARGTTASGDGTGVLYRVRARGSWTPALSQ
jgi:hypothetical protein